MIQFGRTASEYTLTAELELQAPLSEVFAFFSDARNLERITPPFLKFRISDAAALEMKKGLLINYRLSLYGIPFRWQSEISLWNPPVEFIDEQRKGPYSFWIHHHSFKATPNGTLIRDFVRYGVPGGSLIHELFVKRSLRQIFEYRTETIRSLFA